MMILALAVALVSAIWMTMKLSYEYGAINMRMGVRSGGLRPDEQLGTLAE